MTPHRMVNIALLVAGVIGTAIVLLGGKPLDDHSAEWQQSSALADAQRAAREARQVEQNAIRQCTALHGPGAAMGYTVDGDLVCGPRRGSGAVVIASQGGAR